MTQQKGTESAHSARVLVVEDDRDIAEAIQRSLRYEGYRVEIASDGVAALKALETLVPDLILLDLGLPRLDGSEVLIRLREQDDVPVLVVTARDAVESRVAELDAGADDYLVKPFDRKELLARTRALLRRRPPRGHAALVVGDLVLNSDTREARRDDRVLDLTTREFDLLEFFMRNARIVVSRERLLEDVWGYDPFAITNTVEVTISNLRRKLEVDDQPRLLHTLRGAGYVLRAEKPGRGT